MMVVSIFFVRTFDLRFFELVEEVSIWFDLLPEIW